MVTETGAFGDHGDCLCGDFRDGDAGDTGDTAIGELTFLSLTLPNGEIWDEAVDALDFRSGEVVVGLAPVETINALIHPHSN